MNHTARGLWFHQLKLRQDSAVSELCVMQSLANKCLFGTMQRKIMIWLATSSDFQKLRIS